MNGRLEKLLARRDAAKQAREPVGRPVSNRDWSAATLEEIVQRISVVRQMKSRVKHSAAAIRRHDQELRKLIRLRAHKRGNQRAKRKKGLRAQARVAHAALLESQKAARELRKAQDREQKKTELLAAWSNQVPRWPSSAASSIAEMRPREIYRWNSAVDTYVRVPAHLLKIGGILEGDLRRIPLKMKAAYRYQGGTWNEVDAPQLRLHPNPPSGLDRHNVTSISAQNEPVAAVFDSTGMPKLFDLWAMRWTPNQIEEWRLENWTGYREWRQAQANQPKPTSTPELQDDLYLLLVKFSQFQIDIDELRARAGLRMKQEGYVRNVWTFEGIAANSIPVNGSVIAKVLGTFGDSPRALAVLEVLASPIFRWEEGGYSTLLMREILRREHQLECAT